MLSVTRRVSRLLQQHAALLPQSAPTQKWAYVARIGLGGAPVAGPEAVGAAAARRLATLCGPGIPKMPPLGMGQQQKLFSNLSRATAAKQPPLVGSTGSTFRSWQLMGGGRFPPAVTATLLPHCCFAAGAAGRHSATAGALSAAVDDKRRSSLSAVPPHVPQDAAGVQRSPVSSSCRLPLADKEGSAVDRLLGAVGVGLLHPQRALKFAVTFLLNFRFYFMYMARTTFQAVRPLLAFCVFGEVMKLVLATMSSGLFSFLFSFILAFEVLYFFLQCYISYTFLTMFFTVLF